MQKKQVSIIPKSMQQDLAVSQFPTDSAYSIRNMRVVTTGDNTSLCLVNEKSNSEELTVQGTVIGTQVINNYIILFVTGLEGDKPDAIYKIKSVNGELQKESDLYIGNLGFDTSYPIESIGIYENKEIQKVYWVDGKNQPRSINIVADKLRYNKDISELTEEEKSNLYPKGCFDFTQELELNEKITVTREEGGGAFSPGTIQYAFSYYNRYGQESNIFYTTELYNTSFVTRGGSPADIVSNTFHISIKNPETNFQYLRIYSIHRTSPAATPIVKIVTDIEIT